MAQEQLQRIQQLIAAGRFDEARAILQTIDRPEAQQLLTMLDRLEQAAQAARPASAEAGQSDDLLARLSRRQAESPREPVETRPDGTRVYDAGTYEMLWDCQYCGTTRLLAKTHRFCPNCGAAQNPDSRYFPSDDEKVAVEDHVYVGTDKICPACEALNSANAEYCGTCGAPLTEAARARTLEAQTRGEGERFASSGSRDIVQERFDAEMERVGVKPRAGKKRGNPLLKFGLIGLVILIVAGIGVALFWTQESTVYVTGHSWEREIRIEQYGPQSESAWCDSMPAGAYSISRRREVHHYNQVPDGEECDTRRVDQGDGTFREERVCRTVYRDEPVYADRCYYTIDRWSYERSARASGDSVEDTPYWPATNLACEGVARIGCEREAGRSEDYYLHFQQTDGDATYRCPVAQDVWASAQIESRWTLAVSVVGGQPRCNTLEPVQ